MKKLIASLITGLSILSPIAVSAAPIKVLDYEAMTSLSSRWENPENRKLLEERLRINHTNGFTKEFFESSYAANVTEIQKYSLAYRCLSGELNACKTKAAR